MAYQSEIEKLEQRYRENPQQWFAALADSYRKAGDLDLALEVVRVGLEKRPNYVSGHIVKGRCLIDQKKDPDASAAFQRVLELDAENVIALKALSEVSERAGQLDEARRWLTRLLEVDPMNEEAQEAVSRLPAPVASEPSPSALAPTLAPAPEAAPLAGAPEVQTISGLEPTAVGETTVAERPSGKGFLIEKAEEARLEPTGLHGAPAAKFEAAPAAPTAPPVMADLEKLKFTAPPADESAPLPELEAMEFAAPDSTPAESAEAFLDLAEAEAPPAEAPPAEAGEEASNDLPLIFPEDVAAERPPEHEGAPEPEPVVTETMAELYAKQGLLTEARDIYRQLVMRRPGDAALARRLAELEAVPRGGPARRSGQVAAAGGPTVRDFLGEVFAGKPAAETEAPPPPPEGPLPSPMEAAFAEPEPGEDIRGAPTRRASDEVSLASVFGEEPPPVNARPSGQSPAPEEGQKFSFDEFFGSAPPKRAPTTRAARADQEKEHGSDEDDFKRWLKGLKS